MSDSDALTRKQKLTWAIIGLLVIASVAVVAETFTGGFNQYGSGGKLNASAGPEVVLGQNYTLEGGQPATSASINLSKQDLAWLNVSSTGGGPVVQVDTINTTSDGSGHTNVSSISGVGTHNITLQPRRKNFTRVGGGIDSIKITDAKVDDSTADLIYSASSTATIVVETNASNGVQYGLINNDTDEAVDVATAQSDGTVHFTNVDSGTTVSARIAEMGTLFIREELSPHDKITGCTAQGTFFETGDSSNPTILNKTDSDTNGEIDLTGLPVDEEFAVQIQCAGSHNRTILLPDLSQQETVYLLNRSDDTVTVTFDIQDNTGDFSSAGTDFVIQRAINHSIFNSGGFTWDNMAGDEIGAASEVRAVLNHEARYRLKITNDDNETRILGAHVAEANTTVTIRINSISTTADQTQGYFWNFTRINSSGTQMVQFVYNDTQDETTQVELTIHEYGNASRTLHDQTHTGTYGELVVTEQLTGDDRNRTWVAVFTATRDGDTVTGRQVAGRQTNPLGINLDDDWKHRIALLSLVLLGFLVGGGINPQLGSLTVVAAAGMWWYIEWMPTEVTAAAILIAALVAVGFTIGTRQGEPVG